MQALRARHWRGLERWSQLLAAQLPGPIRQVSGRLAVGLAWGSVRPTRQERSWVAPLERGQAALALLFAMHCLRRLAARRFPRPTGRLAAQ